MFSFKHFLDDVVLLEGGSGSGRPGYNDRPKKSLWFKNMGLWYNDIRNHHGSGGVMHVVNSTGDDVSMDGGEEEEITDDLYVIDADKQNCYGCWRKTYKRGISFTKPRPLATIKK